MHQTATRATLRTEASDRALHAFGTAYIFEKRCHTLRRHIRYLTFLGLATPVVLGVSVATFGMQSLAYRIAASATALLAAGQLVCSLWSLVADWPGGLEYSTDSMVHNYRLSNQFRNIAQAEELDSRARFDALGAEEQTRADLDNRRGITDKEKRMAMRAALREFLRPCAGCGKVPTTLSPSDCDVCGNY